MKKCIKCKDFVSSPNHDYCYNCWLDKEDEEGELGIKECNLSVNRQF